MPITFHVGYWDDLGWKDPYAQEAFSQRQMSYAPALAGKGVGGGPDAKIKGPYTPQMVVDGRVHMSGSRRDAVQAEIGKAAAEAPAIALDAVAGFAPGTGPLSIKVRATSRGLPGAGLDTDIAKVGLFAVLLDKEIATQVASGENKGKTLREFQVARVLSGPKLFRSGRPVNQTEFDLVAPAGSRKDNLSVAVFAQDMATMRVLAARAVPIAAQLPEAPK